MERWTFLILADDDGAADGIRMILRAGDNLDGTYAMSTYAESDDPYFGIRRVPYSVNFDRDPLTLAHIADGAACTGLDKQPKCQEPAKCRAGTCALKDPVVCK